MSTNRLFLITPFRELSQTIRPSACDALLPLTFFTSFPMNSKLLIVPSWKQSPDAMLPMSQRL